MSKKRSTSRPRQRQRTYSRPSVTPVVGPQPTSSDELLRAAPTTPEPSGAAVPLAEYAYVVSDLRRIGYTAAAMFATLIVLSLLIS